jgi:hypothetical protein
MGWEYEYSNHKLEGHPNQTQLNLSWSEQVRNSSTSQSSDFLVPRKVLVINNMEIYALYLAKTSRIRLGLTIPTPKSGRDLNDNVLDALPRSSLNHHLKGYFGR